MSMTLEGTVTHRDPVADAVARQRATALKKANDVRVANSHTLQRIRGLPAAKARVLVADMLSGAPSDAVAALKVARLVEAIPGVGPVRATVLLRLIDVRTPSRRVGDLTTRQRLELAEAVRSLSLEAVNPAALTVEQHLIIDALALGYGEGLTLSSDLSADLGIEPRSMGQKLCALERRGLVARRRVAARRGVLFGWELTELGAAESWSATSPVGGAA